MSKNAAAPAYKSVEICDLFFPEIRLVIERPSPIVDVLVIKLNGQVILIRSENLQVAAKSLID